MLCFAQTFQCNLLHKSFVHTYVGLQLCSLLSICTSSFATSSDNQVLTMPLYTIDYCPTSVPFTSSLTHQGYYPVLLKYMTNTTPVCNFESLFPKAILIQITVSFGEPAGNRWPTQIRIIWGDFIYKVTNYKSVGEEWGNHKR